MADLIFLGYVAKAFGLKGGVTVRLFNLDSEALHIGLKLRLKHGQLSKELEVDKILSGHRVFFAGIVDRSSAEALAGSEIHIARSDLPEIDNDEVYLNDMIGMPVVLLSGEKVGEVIDFFTNSAQTLLEVKTVAGHMASIPLVKAIVLNVDFESNKIVIDPPDGLLDSMD